MPLSKEEIIEIMKDDQALALNVLSEEEFHKLHIKGSWNIPLSPDRGAFAQTVEKKFGKERFFIIYAANISSHASFDAVEALQKRGFKADLYLSGMKEWNEAGLPTEGTDISKTAVIE